MSSEVRHAFGQRVRALRLERNFSLRQFALTIGINKSFLVDIEFGRKAPTLDTIERIAGGLGRHDVLSHARHRDRSHEVRVREGPSPLRRRGAARGRARLSDAADARDGRVKPETWWFWVVVASASATLRRPGDSTRFWATSLMSFSPRGFSFFRLPSVVCALARLAQVVGQKIDARAPSLDARIKHVAQNPAKSAEKRPLPRTGEKRVPTRARPRHPARRASAARARPPSTSWHTSSAAAATQSPS